MSVYIRNATEADATQIGYVHVESWKTTYRNIVPESYLTSLDGNKRARFWQKELQEGKDTLLVAEVDTNVVGFLSGGVARDNNGYEQELYALYILENFQGKGIGKQLVREFGYRLVSEGYKTMYVWVLNDNPYKHFYLKLGGTIIGEQEITIAGKSLVEQALGWNSIVESILE